MDGRSSLPRLVALNSFANKQWVLTRRPKGALQLEDFALVARSIPEPAKGEILLRVLYLAMDPAIRGFMNDAGNYAASIEIGAPVRGMVLGQLVRSDVPGWTAGDLAWGFGAWSDYVAAPASQLHRVPHGQSGALTDYLHLRGTIGLTAYYGLFDIARLRRGDSVLISAASGAVGSLAGQMARIAGAARVVGIAGGPDKCARAVERYGYDSCVDYKACTDLPQRLRECLPDGIDVYFDSVGGAVLEAAIGCLAKDARVALCGMISGYDSASPAQGLTNLWNLVVQTASLQGFRVTDFLRDPARTANALSTIEGWIANGQLTADVDVRCGLEAAPETFLQLFNGKHAGRLLVRLDGEPLR